MTVVALIGKLTITRKLGFTTAIFAYVLQSSNLANAASDTTYIPVPKNVIYAGQTISYELLRDRKVPTDYLSRVSVFTGPDGLVGMVARRTLVPSRPIPTNHVSEPDVIKVNAPALMRFSSNGLTITAEVLPMNSAKEGEFVRVRNMQTGVIVSGIAQADGSIMAGVRR